MAPFGRSEVVNLVDALIGALTAVRDGAQSNAPTAHLSGSAAGASTQGE